MELKEIKSRIEDVEKYKKDNEVAHELEDHLFYDFVEAIKNKRYSSLEDVVKAAKAVYEVKGVDFY